MSEIDRRTFLKVGATLAAGVAVGEFMVPVNIKVNEVLEEATGHPTGNAAIIQEIEASCKNADNPQACVQNYEFSTDDKVKGIVVAPIQEELIFRAVPSGIVSATEDREDPIADVLTGTGGFGMSRREFIGGAASSVIFGALHNITDKGIDTKTIPASQTLGGMVSWYLQRKLGIAANTIAHVVNNFKALS